MVQRRLSTTAEGLARRSLPWVAHDAAAPHSATRLLLVSASPNRSGKPFRLRTRMWSESSTMQAFLHGRWDKILPWQSEAVTHWLNGFLHHSAAHPSSRARSTPVADAEMGSSVLDTSIQGTHLRCLRHTREEGKRDLGSPGALGTDQFADRSHRQTTFQDFIQRCDSRSCNRTNYLRCGCERRRNLLCESRFDLKPDCGGGGHGEAYSPIGGRAPNGDCTNRGASEA
jgi:hypothetical protein